VNKISALLKRKDVLSAAWLEARRIIRDKMKAHIARAKEAQCMSENVEVATDTCTAAGRAALAQQRRAIPLIAV
jgi:hypothetical protein